MNFEYNYNVCVITQKGSIYFQSAWETKILMYSKTSVAVIQTTLAVYLVMSVLAMSTYTVTRNDKSLNFQLETFLLKY